MSYSLVVTDYANYCCIIVYVLPEIFSYKKVNQTKYKQGEGKVGSESEFTNVVVIYK